MRSDQVPAQRRTPKRVLLAIGGATCSGKTTLAHALGRALHTSGFSILATDAYYRDLSNLSPAERARQNFDHPDSIDWALLEDHISQLMRGYPVMVPRYDFAAHTRSAQTVPLTAANVLIVEGLLALHSECVRKMACLRVYMDVPDDIALARRIARDVKDRGRTPESVREQFHATVQPMADLFVSPTRMHADLVLRCDTPTADAVDAVLALLEDALTS